MAKIRVTAQHLTSAEAILELNAAEGRHEISDACAVTVASWHQSPGTVGRVLATFASGCTVDSEELAHDVYMTRNARGVDSVNRRDLNMLGTWILDRTDAGRTDYGVAAPLRFAVTARWSNGAGQVDELGYSEARDELEALKRSLDGLAPGDAITITRLP